MPAAPVETAQVERADPARQAAILHWAELAVAVAVTLLVVYLHDVFRVHAGGLWRDEVNTVHVAMLPAFAQTWDNLQFDSFPILIFAVVRGWVALFTADDAALRALGMLIGVGVFGALWVNARVFEQRTPLLALILLGCNPLFIRYADSLRAYGLGILLMLLTFGAVWRVVESARPGRWAVAAVLALLSVQCLYYNAVLLLSMCVAGAVICAGERAWARAVAVLGLGGPAALSLLPYAGTIHRLHEWNFLVQYPVTLPWIWARLSDVTGAPDPLGIWIWGLLFAGAVALAGWRGRSLARTRAERVLAYAVLTLVIGTMAYAAFLKALNYHTQPWYYVAYLALAAACLDAAFGAVCHGRWRWARLGFVWAFGALMFMQTEADLWTRQTNMDLVGRQLTAAVAPGDVVVNSRWECDITFARYYRGAAADLTLPPIADHRFHRYDLVLQQMMTPDAAQPVLDRMEQALREGHRVWLVGAPRLPAAGETAMAPVPAWRDAGGWHGGGDYYDGWALQAGDLLARHAKTGAGLEVPVPGLVEDYEDLPVNVFSGWR